MRRTKEAALETRNRILNSAETVFYQEGVAHTSLSDVAAAAGVTRGAIYGHFRNKADLFGAMIDRVQLPIGALFAATVDPLGANPLSQLRHVIVLLLCDVASNEQVHRVFDVLFTKCEYSIQMDQLAKRNVAAAREARHRIARAVLSAVTKGQLPVDLDVRRAAAMLHAMIGGVLREWLLDNSALSLPIDAECIADACLDLLRFSAALRTPAAKTHAKMAESLTDSGANRRAIQLVCCCDECRLP
jgi:TetR/AcrR family acrAB operon transcriptional repressor